MTNLVAHPDTPPPTRLHEFLEAAEEAILVELIGTRGSTPRDAGARMAVTREGTCGTIGGGAIEREAMARAREMLARGAGRLDRALIERPLGHAATGQFGGRMRLMLRRATPRDAQRARERFAEEWITQPPVLVFGAGHVGQALARALAPLPLRTTFVDGRVEAVRALPQGTDWELTDQPLPVVRDAGAATSFVIATHSPALDFAIARAAIARGDAAYVGMVGSGAKRAAFLAYAARARVPVEKAERLICPVATHARRDKRPAVIAAFLAAEVLGVALRSRGAGPVADRPLAAYRPSPGPVRA